jgi:hypothetical protein
MPFTFFSHQAPVLPLKRAWPHYFSGQALVLGSMSPDFEFFLTGKPAWGPGHSLVGQFIFCLPMTLLMVWIVSRLLARPVALHLPDAGSFHLHDYQVLAQTPRRRFYWLKAVPSALIGSFSHITWDSFTHSAGWSARRLGYAHTILLHMGTHSLSVCKFLQSGSTLLGGAVVLLMLHSIGKHRCLLRWAGQTALDTRYTPSPAGLKALWLPPLVTAILGLAMTCFLWHRHSLPARFGFWTPAFLFTTTSAFAGLCLGAVLCIRHMRRTEGGKPTD